MGLVTKYGEKVLNIFSRKNNVKTSLRRRISLFLFFVVGIFLIAFAFKAFALSFNISPSKISVPQNTYSYVYLEVYSEKPRIASLNVVSEGVYVNPSSMKLYLPQGNYVKKIAIKGITKGLQRARFILSYDGIKLFKNVYVDVGDVRYHPYYIDYFYDYYYPYSYSSRVYPSSYYYSDVGEEESVSFASRDAMVEIDKENITLNKGERTSVLIELENFVPGASYRLKTPYINGLWIYSPLSYASNLAFGEKTSFSLEIVTDENTSLGEYIIPIQFLQNGLNGRTIDGGSIALKVEANIFVKASLEKTFYEIRPGKTSSFVLLENLGDQETEVLLESRGPKVVIEKNRVTLKPGEKTEVLFTINSENDFSGEIRVLTFPLQTLRFDVRINPESEVIAEAKTISKTFTNTTNKEASLRFEALEGEFIFSPKETTLAPGETINYSVKPISKTGKYAVLVDGKILKTESLGVVTGLFSLGAGLPIVGFIILIFLVFLFLTRSNLPKEIKKEVEGKKE